jgi:hypothetical protein
VARIDAAQVRPLWAGMGAAAAGGSVHETVFVLLIYLAAQQIVLADIESAHAEPRRAAMHPEILMGVPARINDVSVKRLHTGRQRLLIPAPH